MNAIDLLWVRPQGGVVTIRPNPKNPKIQLFYIGSSGSAPLNREQRKKPVSQLVIEFPVPEGDFTKKDLIVLETFLDGNRVSHLLELTWREDRSSRIYLSNTWISAPGRVIQSFTTKEGRTGLSVMVGSILCATINRDGSDGVDADIICQYAAGRITDFPIPQGADKVTGSADTYPNVAAEQLAQFLAEAISIAQESFSPFKKGRIRRIRELWARLLDANQDILAFRKYLRRHIR
jgi:hypothetical protein